MGKLAGKIAVVTGAKAVCFLASDDSSYVTSVQLFVDGGLAQI